MVNQQIDLNAARLVLNGSWDLKGRLDLEVTADLRRAKRSRVSHSEDPSAFSELATIRLTGPLGQVRVESVEAETLARRSTLQ